MIRCILKQAMIVLTVSVLINTNSHAGEVKTLRLSDTQVASIPVSIKGTVFSFPAKPTKVILGNTGSFGIEYVENDLAISPLRANARSNLFVYALGRRFTFDLYATVGGGHSLVEVKDAWDEPPSSKPKGVKTHGK